MKRFIIAFILIAACYATAASYGQSESQTTFSFSSKEEANQELSHPQVAFLPTNKEIVARYDAVYRILGSNLTGIEKIRNINQAYDDYVVLFDGGINSLDKVSGNITTNNTTADNLDSLEWQVEIPETVYSGEPIPLKIELKNASDKAISFRTKMLYPAFYLNSMNLIRLNSSDSRVLMTKHGIAVFYNGWATSGMRLGRATLAPGEKTPLDVLVGQGSQRRRELELDLTEFFDLTEPGEYELTFYTRRFINDDGAPAEDQEREFPRKSTARFRILPKE